MKYTPTQALLLDKIQQSPVADWDWEFAYEVQGVIAALRSKRDYEEMRKSERRSKHRSAVIQRRREKSIALSDHVIKGDVVRMRGTRHGGGWRQVMEIEDADLVCRKLIKNRDGTFSKDEYITRHGRDKVAEILETWEIV